MKNTKLTVKFFLIIALFASTAFADGHMGGGGAADDDGHMGGGGRTCNPQTQNCVVTCNPQTQNCVGNRTANEEGDEEENLIFNFVRDFLASLLG